MQTQLRVHFSSEQFLWWLLCWTHRTVPHHLECHLMMFLPVAHPILGADFMDPRGVVDFQSA